MLLAVPRLVSGQVGVIDKHGDQLFEVFLLQTCSEEESAPAVDPVFGEFDI